MAEIIENTESRVDGDFGSIEDLAPKKALEQQAAEENSTPEKSREQLAKELADAQSMIGRQSKSVSEMRREIDDLKTADAYTRGQLSASSKPEAKKDSSDYFADPEKAIQEKIESELKSTNAELNSMKIEQRTRDIQSAHPDAAQVIESDGFKEFIAKSPSRTIGYKTALSSMDVGLWNELLSEFKGNSQVQSPDVEHLKNVDVRESVNAASMGGTSGSSQVGSSGKRIRKEDLMKLYTEDRDRYEALWPEIQKAYEDGRVV